MTIVAGKALLDSLLRANKADEVLREIESRWEEVSADIEYVYLRCRALVALGRSNEAIALAEGMASGETGSAPIVALRQLMRARELQKKGRQEDAIEELRLAPSSDSHKLDAAIYHVLAICEIRTGMTSKARESLLVAASHYEACHHYVGFVRCLVSLAEVERLNGNLQAAIETLKHAAEKAHEYGLFFEEGRAHYNLGVCYLTFGRLRAASSHFDSSVFQTEEHGREPVVNLAKLASSLLKVRSGKLATAQTEFVELLYELRITGPVRDLGLAHEGLGELRLAQAQPGKATLHFRRSIKLARMAEDSELEYESQYRLAEAELGCGRLEIARELATKARDAFLSRGNRFDAAAAARIAAQALLCQRKWKEATAELREALASCEEIDEQFEVHRVRRLLEAAGQKALVQDIRAAERPKWGVNIVTKSKTTGGSTVDEPDIICGNSHRFLRFLAEVDRGAKSTVPILIEGETGTGKELIAQRIHARSSRRTGPYVAFNCGTSTPELFDAEVFGHLKGSFTGAATDRKGLARTANTGTLFLDEIGEMTRATQARMLRLLDSGEVRPVGSDEVVRTDMRLISATHQDLDGMIDKSEFRQDLFYRLATIRLRIPALRERIEDLELLFQHFRDEAARSGAGTPLGISDNVLQKMADYAWPGNVRELRNSVYRLAGTFDGALITTWWPGQDRRHASTRDKVSKDEMIELLWETEGSVTRVSERLTVSRPVIYRLLKQWGLDVDDFRSRPRSKAL